jgi:hypothetical protein
MGSGLVSVDSQAPANEEFGIRMRDHYNMGRQGKVFSSMMLYSLLCRL